MEYEFVVRVFHVDEQNIVVIPLFIHKKDNSMWVTLKIMSELFGVNRSEAQRHIKDIFEDKKLDSDTSTQSNNNIVLYDLDVLISVGFRINTDSAFLFRKWVKTIKEYIFKGFAVDEELFDCGCRYNSYCSSINFKLAEFKWNLLVGGCYCDNFDIELIDNGI